MAQEIQFWLSPGGGINNAFQNYGVKGIQKAFFVVTLNFPDELRRATRQELNQIKNIREEKDLHEHYKF